MSLEEKEDICQFCGHCRNDSSFVDKSVDDFYTLVKECESCQIESQEMEYITERESILCWLLINATEVELNVCDIDTIVSECMGLSDADLNLKLRDYGVILVPDDYEEKPKSAFIHAAKKGDPEIISWLFQFLANDFILKYAIYEAAKSGKLKNIIRIFNLGLFDTDLYFVYETVCIIAAQYGFLDILKWTYDLYLKIDSKACCSIFKIALKNKFYHICKWMLDQRSCILETEGYGMCYIAANSGKIELVKWLLENNFELCGEGYIEVSASPLHAAAENGHLDLLKWLLQRGCNVRDRNYEGLTPLHSALQAGHLKCAEYLIHINEHSIMEKSESGNTVLHLAAMSGNLECVKLVLQHGADIVLTVLNSYKCSALHTAAKHLDIVKYLVEQGCNIHLKNDEKKTVLSLAAMSNIFSVVEWLLMHTDSDINDAVSGASAWIYSSSESDNWDMFKLLLSYLPKWDINTLHHDETLLMKSVDNIEAVKLLIEHGADVNVKSDSNNTALHKALSYGTWDVAEYLIKHGANVNIKDSNGSTVLEHALRRDSYSLNLIKSLIEAGADLKEKNEEGDTVLHVAVENDSVFYIKLLIANGADVNALNNENISVVQKAAHHNEWNNVKHLFIEECAVVTMEHYNYLMYHAIYFRRLDIVQWIADICPSPELVNVELPGQSSIIFNSMFITDTTEQLENIQICIKYGAEINGFDWENETILYKLVDNYDVVQCLLQHGAQTNIKCAGGKTALHKIVSVDYNIHIMKQLKKTGKREDSLNLMLCNCASDIEKSKIVSLLLKFGANINAKDDTGKSVLHIAAANKHSYDIARLLVTFGADINAQDNQGNTILHTMHFGDLTSYLIEHNANVKIKNRKGKTVLHKAAALTDVCVEEKPVSTVQWLQRRTIQNKVALTQEAVLTSISVNRYLTSLTYLIQCSNIHEKDNEGLTALHHAALKGNLMAFICLIKHGACIDAVTNTGDNVLHIATLQGHSKIIKHIITLDYANIIQQKNNNLDTVIHLAVRSPNADITKLVLDNCVDTNVNVSDKNKDQLTALHLAVVSNNIYIVRYLLDSNADMFVPNLDDMTPIHLAVKYFHVLVFKTLIQHLILKDNDNYQKILCNLRNNKQESLLHIAVMNSNYDMECIDMLKYILKEKLSHVNAQDMSGKTALHYLCREFMFKTVTTLVDNGCDINIQDKKGNTAFHVAVKVGSFEITEFLFAHGGNIKIKNQRGNSPLQIAAAHGKIKLIKHFLKNETNNTILNTKNKKGLYFIHNISNSGGLKLLNFWIDRYPETNIHALSNKKQTALALVLKYKLYTRIVFKLLEFGVTNKPDVFSNTEMHIACRYASESHIQEMLNKNADVNIQNKTGNTAMHIAVKYASLECSKIMLSKYINVNLYNNKGYNLLHVACCSQNIETIEHWIKVLGVDSVTKEGNNLIGVALSEDNTLVFHYLIIVKKHSEWLSHKNFKGETILQYCLSLSNQTLDTLDYLIQQGADIHDTNNEGDSCLHVATSFGKADEVNYFIEHGIDVNVRNNKGFTPMHVAAQNGYTDFVKLLYQHGGDVNARDNEGSSVLQVASINNNASVVRYLSDLVMSE